MTDKNADTGQKAKAKGPKKRRGMVIYDTNPFISGAVGNTKQGVRKITNKAGDMMVVSQSTGEVLGQAGATGFWHAQEVDKTKFVKLYINGVKAFKELTSAGTKVFEVLYLEVQKEFGKDKVYLSFNAVDQDITPMSDATYTRGMRELVAKGFIAPTVTQGLWFINPDYMWSGDRLAFVKEYRKAPTPTAIGEKDTKTRDMFDEDTSQRFDEASEELVKNAQAEWGDEAKRPKEVNEIKRPKK
jgi:hypothetical protein